MRYSNNLTEKSFVTIEFLVFLRSGCSGKLIQVEFRVKQSNFGPIWCEKRHRIQKKLKKSFVNFTDNQKNRKGFEEVMDIIKQN